MAGFEEGDYKKNPNLLMIRPNEWIDSNLYKYNKVCTLYRINDQEYEFVYGAAWVQIKKENNSWVYYPLGNKAYKSKPFTWFGDLLDAAAEDMYGSKL